MPKFHTVYGKGGYDPSKPNDNIVEQFELIDEPFNTNHEDLAHALSLLPQESLDAIRKSLGI